MLFSGVKTKQQHDILGRGKLQLPAPPTPHPHTSKDGGLCMHITQWNATNDAIHKKEWYIPAGLGPPLKNKQVF